MSLSKASILSSLVPLVKIDLIVYFPDNYLETSA